MYQLRRIPSIVLIAVVAALVVAGCGGRGSSASTSKTTKDVTGMLAHIDGGLKLDGPDLLTVIPTNGAAALQMQLGPDVAKGTLQSLIASGSKARVFYAKGPIAVQVEAAPSASDGAQTYDGQVVAVGATSITIDGPTGKRTFAIRKADAAAFDVAHLEEHRAEHSPVRVYFRSNGKDEHAVAYEDA